MCATGSTREMQIINDIFEVSFKTLEETAQGGKERTRSGRGFSVKTQIQFCTQRMNENLSPNLLSTNTLTLKGLTLKLMPVAEVQNRESTPGLEIGMGSARLIVFPADGDHLFLTFLGVNMNPLLLDNAFAYRTILALLALALRSLVLTHFFGGMNFDGVAGRVKLCSQGSATWKLLTFS